MMPTPLLSVIVANYNNAGYLGECLESVLEQTLKDLEIVICDDGSTDGSPAIVENFAQRYPGIVKGVYDPVNRGVAHARHQAILASRGEYLTTLDSDDFYCNRLKLEKEIALIRKFQAEEKKEIISFSNVLLVTGHSPATLWGNSGTIVQGMIGQQILCRSCFIPRDFVMRRDSYFLAGGYDLRLKIYEDWDLKIRLAFRHEFHFSDAVGTAYRRHGRGLSALPFPEQRAVLSAVFEKNLPLTAVSKREAIRCAFEEWLAGAERRF